MADRKAGNTVGNTFDPTPHVRRLTPPQLAAIADRHILPADAELPGVGVVRRAERRGRPGRIALHPVAHSNAPILVRLAQLAARAERRRARRDALRRYREWRAEQRLDYPDESPSYLRRRARKLRLLPLPRISEDGASGAAAQLTAWGVLRGDGMPSDPVLADWRRPFALRRVIDCAILDDAITLGFLSPPAGYRGWMAERVALDLETIS